MRLTKFDGISAKLRVRHGLMWASVPTHHIETGHLTAPTSRISIQKNGQQKIKYLHTFLLTLSCYYGKII